MRLVAVIPARGGSKGIPGKNIATCAGKPLLAWTCEAARAARSLGRTLLSTDAEDIAAVARRWGVEVPFMRPAALAADDTPAVPVLQHALEWLEGAGEHPDALVLLQPTSPLRRAEHIDAAARLFEAGSADTVVSVVDVPHRYHPDSVVIERDGTLQPYRAGTETVTRRQDQQPLLARNGPAVLIVSRAMVKAGKLYGGRTVGYRMARQDSIDVDTPEELALATLLLRSRGAQP
jgi:CMP-N,N'-diacetyllegionaminic acid synthase